MDEQSVTTVTLGLFLLRGRWGNTAIVLHYVCVDVWEGTVSDLINAP